MTPEEFDAAEAAADAARVSSPAVAHIRRRYPRAGGNQFYRDRRTFDDGEFLTWTFCGAEVTDRDLAWAQRGSKWARGHACPACLEAVEAVG